MPLVNRKKLIFSAFLSLIIDLSHFTLFCLFIISYKYIIYILYYLYISLWVEDASGAEEEADEGHQGEAGGNWRPRRYLGQQAVSPCADKDRRIDVSNAEFRILIRVFQGSDLDPVLLRPG